MSNRQTPIGFSLNDFFTRIVPGSVPALPVLGAYILKSQGDIPNASLIIGMFIIISFMLGELFEHLRKQFALAPDHFYLFISKFTQDTSMLPKRYRVKRKIREKLPLVSVTDPTNENYLPNRLDLDFQKSIENNLGIDISQTHPTDIHDLLYIYMEPNLTQRTRRYRSLSAFISNLQISIWMTSLVYFLSFLSDMSNEIAGVSILILVMFGGTLAVYGLYLGDAGRIYTELLIKEYYLKEQIS